MKILFVMDQRVDRGSIQAVANYVRAGDGLGHRIALYGHEDSRFPTVRFSTDVSAFDYVVFLVESWRHWMSGLRMPRIFSEVPRRRRAIVDADGKYNPVICVDDYDRNYLYEEDRAEWVAHYRQLTDKIMQPTFRPVQSGVIALPFYGYDADSRICPDDSPKKNYDLVHVGHNWWRWREIRNCLLPALEQIRSQLDGICFMGAWWDVPPVGAKNLQLEAAFGVDNGQFQRLRIQVKPPVPYTHVIRAMSEGRVNIMTQRPLFRHLKILTSKYFEIFSANTIPLVMLDPDHAQLVYGPAGRELALYSEVANKLMDVLNHPQKYYEIVQEVRQYLCLHHSYHVRVQELVAALQE